MPTVDAALSLLGRLDAAHPPLDDKERRDRLAVAALLRSPGSPGPFSRHRWMPGHLTASGLVVSPDGAQALLILHAKLGRWLQPGGHVDPTDGSLAEAAAREVREETGLTVSLAQPWPVHVDLHQIPARPARGGRPAEPAHQHHDVRFAFRATNVDAVADDDALDARWVPIDEPDALRALRTDASVRRLLAAWRGRR